MGARDSSRTRVAPVFDRLFAVDPSGRTWLPKLLGLVAPPRIDFPHGNLEEARWWPLEKPLPAPIDLLRHLVRDTPSEPTTPAGWGKATGTKERRERLTKKDPETIQQALDLLGAGKTARAWYVLEGPSSPDVFLSTSDAIVVIEGKRTEGGPTDTTYWMVERPQMLRHLDAAFEMLKGRKLFGLMIVEDRGVAMVPTDWVAYLDRIKSTEALGRALPHRTPEARQLIADSLLGVTTWQDVCSAMSIPTAVLIDTVRIEDLARDYPSQVRAPGLTS